MKEMKVRLTFVDDILGGTPGNEDIFRTYVGSKAPDPTKMEDEVAALGVEGVVEKGKTIFPKKADGTPFLYAYQIRGFFKGAAGAMREVSGSRSSGLKAYKRRIDRVIFVREDKVPFINWGMIDECQRPLRASTPQGERVSIAISESISEGTMLEFTVVCLVDGDMEYVREWLDYGPFSGIGQWRNSGKGRFTWEEIA